MSATHRGHCQLCGSLQKLPKGMLSLHGYKVTHGFFSGVCGGAKALPFEQSIALIAQHIALAQTRIANIEQFQHTLRTTIDADTKMWIRTYMPRANGCGGYVSTLVELTATMGPDYDGWQRISYCYTDANGVTGDHYNNGFKGVPPYEMKGATCEQLRQATVLRYNALHARSLEREVRQLQAYVSWQTDRCKNWSVKPLFPVEGKFVNTAFKPEEVQ